MLFYYLARCFTCYNIIKVDLDISGEIAYFDLHGDYHECCNVNTVAESDKFTQSGVVVNIFLELINTQHKDQETGELIRSYYEQAKDLIYKISVYNPPPVFVVHLSDIRDDKIKQES